MPKQWFIRQGDKVFGPFDSTKLKSLATEGKINESTQVAQQAAGPWANAGAIQGLFVISPPSSAAPAAPLTTPPPLPTPASPAASTVTAALPRPWFRRWYFVFLLYPFLAFIGCGVVIQMVVPKETLERWDAEAKERSKRRAAQKKESAKSDSGTQKIAQHGYEVGFAAARSGMQKPTPDQLDAMSRQAAAHLNDQAGWGFKMVWKDGFWAGWRKGGG